MAISVVSFAKGLALGRLSLHAASKGFYDTQGGDFVVPEALVEQAVSEYESAKEIVSRRAPDVVANYLTDDFLERSYADRVKTGADEIFPLVDFYAGIHFAHLTILKCWEAAANINAPSLLESNQDRRNWPTGPCPIVGVMSSRELLRDELLDLVDDFDRIDRRPPEDSTLALLASIEAITLFIRRLKIDIGMTLAEQVEGGVH